jgi:hypothetical protein
MSLSTRRPAVFDWAIYADATFAGLSILIPIPFVDSFFEWIFSRRMLRAIARRAGRPLAPAVLAEIERDDASWLVGCLFLPITLTWSLLKRVSKKILYFLTIKEATDKLSYYWHRAFLLDYMLAAGHLDDPGAAHVGRLALAHTLNTAGTSPLTQLARQVVSAPKHILASLRRARRGQEDAEMQERRSRIARAWDSFGSYLAGLAERYDRAFATALATRQAQAAEAGRAEAQAAAAKSWAAAAADRLAASQDPAAPATAVPPAAIQAPAPPAPPAPDLSAPQPAPSNPGPLNPAPAPAPSPAQPAPPDGPSPQPAPAPPESAPTQTVPPDSPHGP